jgi:hypothetical protein
VAIRSIRQSQRPPPRQPHCIQQGFLKDLAEVWSGEGRETMVKTARTSPATFFAVCARLIRQEAGGRTDLRRLQAEDYAVLRAIRKAISDADNQSPQAVLEHVRDTLAAAQAKQI